MVQEQARAERRQADLDRRLDHATELLREEALDALYAHEPEPVSTSDGTTTREQLVVNAIMLDEELAELIAQTLLACAVHEDDAPQRAIRCIERIANSHAVEVMSQLHARGGFDEK